MGFEKVAGFFIAAAGGFIVVLATFVFALVTYRRRREPGFLLLLCALGSGLAAKLLWVLFLGPGTFFPLEYTIKNMISRLAWGLNALAPVLALIGWVFLSRKKEEPINHPPQTTTGSSAPDRV